jgi:hypothetical protein
VDTERKRAEEHAQRRLERGHAIGHATRTISDEDDLGHGAFRETKFGDEGDHEGLRVGERGVRFEEGAWIGELGAFDEEDEIGVELGGGLAEGSESVSRIERVVWGIIFGVATEMD